LHGRDNEAFYQSMAGKLGALSRLNVLTYRSISSS